MSVNLETRRKRRDSSAKLAIRRMSVFHSPPERIEDENGGPGKSINQALPIRAGAKRKLAAREEDGKAETRSEGFIFSRKGASTPDEDAAKSESKPRARKESTVGPGTSLSDRRALGESKFLLVYIFGKSSTNGHNREHQYRSNGIATESNDQACSDR
jgi:hypothetical protein